MPPPCVVMLISDQMRSHTKVPKMPASSSLRQSKLESLVKTEMTNKPAKERRMRACRAMQLRLARAEHSARSAERHHRHAA